MDFRQIKAIEQKNKDRLLRICPTLDEDSGIYILTRQEFDFKYAYIGQAKHILTRLAQHLTGYQHIDLSLNKHGFWAEQKFNGWHINFVKCNEEDLDREEQQYIKLYANNGYQMRNKTAGGQSNGKFEIAETKEKKGFRDGIKSGYKKAKQEISKLFDKNLTYSISGKTNKNKEKALKKFKEFLGEIE